MTFKDDNQKFISETSNQVRIIFPRYLLEPLRGSNHELLTRGYMKELIFRANTIYITISTQFYK